MLRPLFITLTVSIALASNAVFSEGAVYEVAPTLQASSILEPELLRNKNYTIEDRVENDGFFNHYTVKTRFGTFEAGSTGDLRILLNEIDAIARMKQVETEDTVVAALKQSGRDTVSGVQNLFKDPEGTFKGAASGVSSLFNRAKTTVGRREATDAEDSTLEQLVGISKSKGEIASKYGVNVYSDNKVLQEELDRLGRADYFGGLGIGVVTGLVPGVGGVVLSTSGAARILNEAINTTPAPELWRQNKAKLVAIGLDEDTVELFLNNPSFSPAFSTVMVKALESLRGVQKRDLLIKVALQAANPAMASTIVKHSVMTANFHERVSSLQRLAPMARLTQGVRKDGTRILLLPVDYMIWSKRVADAISDLSSEVKSEKLELWLLGDLSAKANVELGKLGWKVYTGAGGRLLSSREE